MARKPQTPFGVGPDGTLYVEVEAAMPLFVAMIDGVVLSKFPRDKKYYMTLDDGIAWCKREAQELGNNYDDKILLMERCKAAHSTAAAR